MEDKLKSHIKTGILCFGYYTNGRSLNRKFKIIIEPDTIKIKSK